jgi:small GTP-binding protein
MSIKKKIQPPTADKEVETELPPGVTLLRTLEGHQGMVTSVAFDPQSQILASGSHDHTVKLWDTQTGKLLHTLAGYRSYVWSVAFDPQSGTLASGSNDDTVQLWDTQSGKLLCTFEDEEGVHQGASTSLAFNPQSQMLAMGRHHTVKLWDTQTGKLLHTLTGRSYVWSVAFDPQSGTLASGIDDNTVQLWDTQSGEQLRVLEGHQSQVLGVAFHPNGEVLVSASSDKTVKLWELSSGKLLRTLEGHTLGVETVAFSPDGRLLASKSSDRTIRLWSCATWETVAVIPNPTNTAYWSPALTFHPTLPQLVTDGTKLDTPGDEGCRLIHLWELDFELLLGQRAAPSVSYTSAKVVLVGDSGVGKTGLGWRLAHGEFKEHASTHGQQFWLLNQLCQQRRDGTHCETVLWDLAGQPDYRLIHALFLDNVDLALVLFDPTRDGDPLSGVEFWLRQLKVGAADNIPTLLIASRSDRGMPRLTQEELEAFCKQRGISAYLPTSAKESEGIDLLIQRMQGLVDWDSKPPTTTTDTFKRTKDFVLELKEKRRRKLVFMPEELRKQLEKTDRKWRFTDAEMLTAVGHLANHGYVTRLKTSRGEPRILLSSELLNNLAASFVLEARRNVKGLGSLEEQKLLSGGYQFPELKKLGEAERDILLDSAAVLFLEHNICFRETDPHNAHTYLVFPELINLKRPLEDDGKPVEDGVSYTASGAVENVYASLVVLMGYTQTFTRTNQWQNHARYEVGNGQVCGFRLVEERAGEQDFVLYFGTDTAAPVRMLFQSLFENFLARRNLTVRRLEPVYCMNGHSIDRVVVRKRMSSGSDFAFCSECGEKTSLPQSDQPIQLTKKQTAEMEANRRTADERSRFEQVLFRLKAYVMEQKSIAPECFISYAWGNPEHEHWVEKRLATDLQKAGIGVLLDRWDNSLVGSSVARFVERLEKSDRIVMVGTPLYRRKYENKETDMGYVVAAEVDLIHNRLLGTEAQKESVLPLLLAGEKTASLPPLLHGRVYADFRDETMYFTSAFNLILSLYQLPPNHPSVIDLRDSLRAGDNIGRAASPHAACLQRT